jgi:hypothetical protein
MDRISKDSHKQDEQPFEFWHSTTRGALSCGQNSYVTANYRERVSIYSSQFLDQLSRKLRKPIFRHRSSCFTGSKAEGAIFDIEKLTMPRTQ